MKRFLIFLIVILVLNAATCNNSNQNLDSSTTVTGNPCQGITNPFNFTAAPIQCAEVPYGLDPKQKYDIYIPQTTLSPGTKRPIVIYIHGGGFIGQDKRNHVDPTKTSGSSVDIKAFLSEGYAVASINYRLLKKNGETEGIRKCIQDCKDAIAHIRNLPNTFQSNQTTQNLTLAPELNPNKIALWGSSAGAGIAMLIAFEGGTTIRPYKAVWVDKPQATYDLNLWHGQNGIFPSCSLTKVITILTKNRAKAIYGKGNVQGFSQNYLLTNPGMVAYRNEVDILNYIDGTDPPIWIENTKPANNVVLNSCLNNMADELLNHHINHADKLQSILDTISVEWHLTKGTGYTHTGTWQGSGKEFVMSKF